MDLLAHRLHDLVDAVGDAAGAVAVATGHADHAAGAAHRRPKEAAGVHGVADGEFDIVLAAAVADGGDAALERALHELHATHRELGRAHAVLNHARIALGARQRMDMAVDHARDQRGARRVDALAAEAGKFTSRRHTLDAATLFQNGLTVLRFFAIEQAASNIQRGHDSLPTDWMGALCIGVR